jgi:hypothetical protein
VTITFDGSHSAGVRGQRPRPPLEAVGRLLQRVGRDEPYTLGTERDCAGVVCDAYGLTRHRQGFARGKLPPEWAKFADVEDDINTNSMIKDALINREIFRFVPDGALLSAGDLLAYPTIRIRDADDDELHTFIGHVQMVLEPNGGRAGGPYTHVQVMHSHGPNGRRPAVTVGFADVMDKHNEKWPKPHHKAWALRAVP